MKKFFSFLVSLVLIAAIVASIGWYLFVYDRDFTRDFLLSQARYNDLYGNSRPTQSRTRALQNCTPPSARPMYSRTS